MIKMSRFFSLIILLALMVAEPMGGQSLDKKIIRPTTASSATTAATPARPPLLSPGVMVGDTLYLAGQGSRDPKTGQHPEGFEAQVKQALENLGAVLKAAGLDFSHVVKSNVYLTDINNFSKMNGVYRTYFKADPPARTTIAVPSLPGGSQIEITFIASRAPKQIIRPAGLAPFSGSPYSMGVMAGDTLYLSGQGANKPGTGEMVAGGTAAEVKQTMENCGAILKAAGLDFSHVVSSNVYLTDIAQFEQMNEVYRTYFKRDLPARATVAVPALPGGTPVEITMVASRAAKKIVQPEGVRPSANFSQAVQVGNISYLSGKVGAGDSLEAQVKSAMDSLGTVLKAAGQDFSNVVEAKVYLTDMNDYAAMNEVYRSYFKGDPPARTCLAVAKLVGTTRVEVTFVTTGAK